MRATVAELKKRNRKAVNVIKHMSPVKPGEIYYYFSTVRPLMRRAGVI